MTTGAKGAAALVLALTALAGCGGTENGGEAQPAPPAGPAKKTIAIVEKDYLLKPALVRLDEPGTYTFRAVNEGDGDHALEIEGQGLEQETQTIVPSETADLTVELKAGEYELYCPVDGHRKLGMEGKIIVGGGQGSGGGGTTTREDDSGGGMTTGEDDDSGGYGY